MKKQAIAREYNFSDAELYTWCLERLAYVERDAQEFAGYSFGASRLEAFKTLCQQFAALPDDDELLGDQMLATDKKNEAREALKLQIRSVMTRVATKYDIKEGRYRKFGTSKMNDMTDPQLFFCGLRVVRVGEKLLDFLAETGLKQEHLDKVKQAAYAFEAAMQIQQDKIADRDIAVEKRIELGNELYRELVLICNIGKDIWISSNKAKYDQYCLYESNNDQKKARKEKLKKEKESEAKEKDQK